MMMTRLARFLALLMLTSPTAALRPASADDKPSARFRTEGLNALAELEQRCQRLECAGDTKFLKGVADVPESMMVKRATEGLRYKIRDQAVLLSFEKAAAPGPADRPDRGLRAHNAREAFVLSQTNDPPRVKLARYPEGHRDFTEQRSRIDVSLKDWIGPIYADLVELEKSLPALIDDPECLVTAVEDVRRDGSDFVRVALDRTRGVGEQVVLQKVELMLSPRDHWAVHEAELRTLTAHHHASYRVSVRYGAMRDGFPTVERITIRIRLDEASDEAQKIFEIREWTYRDVPERDFQAETYLDEDGKPRLDPRP